MKSLIIKIIALFVIVSLSGCAGLGYKVVNIKDESAMVKSNDYIKQDYACSEFGGVLSYSHINVVECKGGWQFWNKEWLDGDGKVFGGVK